VREKIASVTPEGKITIASSTRMEGDYEKIWNSLFVINSGAKLLEYYDKHHLVPFGEYVPFRDILPIDKITPGMLDFSAGNEGKTLSVNGMKFLPLICYEIIFPHYADGDYDFIVNITNDAWFGDSTGPQQHLAMTQMRAIEQGRPVLRAANTGVSAVIDQFGRIKQKIDYGKKGIITASIPPVTRTLYSVLGDLIFLSLILCSIISALIRTKKKSN
jgi:apolipoprotein N-acyltransferase